MQPGTPQESEAGTVSDPAGGPILVVDDEPHIVKLVSLYLKRAGFQVVEAFDGRQALELARSVQPSLILLDVMMPELDGLEVCRRIRQESNVPIIMLTARTEDVDKVLGLSIGADDYVTKPFSPPELLARVGAVLRRARPAQGPPSQEPFTVGDLTIDPGAREARVGGRRLDLAPKEFDLLTALARVPNLVMDRDRLLDVVWGSNYFGDTRTVDVHVSWLREKLAGSRVRIRTVWGVGYKLVD
ncbi:MAG TPA: response regulator transcription factor, partial [Dehalococcoidia bacterium]